jgi:hypothetical protein
MGQPAFTIIEDDCREPLVARAYARKTSFGRRSLAEALAARKDVGGPKDVVVEAPDEKTLAQCYTFPDDAVLLMIGSTQELEDACKEAIAAGILALVTATQQKLQLYYARIEVHWLSGQVDTLIAIGRLHNPVLPSWPSEDAWLEYPAWQDTPGLHGQPTYVTTADDRREPCALPPIIRWIEQNDDQRLLKAY